VTPDIADQGAWAIATPDLAEHLRTLEVELTTQKVRRSRAALEALLTPDYIEFGASGRAYDRASTIETLLAEGAAPRIALEDVAVRVMAPDVALLTYRSVIEHPAGGTPTVALRASLWHRQGDGAWRLAFHQGTPSR
jgi:hypothetical protein